MSLDHKFIPLYFGEDDEDLWQFLQIIKPEERVAYIKLVLRDSLLSESKPSLNNYNKVDVEQTHDESLFENSIIENCIVKEDDEKILDSNFQEDDQIEYSLQDLFVGEGETLTLTSQAHTSGGLEHLLTQIIGEEDDEAVIKAIQIYNAK